MGKDAADKLTKSVDNIVKELPAILQQIDDLIKNNIGAVDQAMAHQIQEINKLLKQNIDGINAALQQTIDNVDAMLAARLNQIFTFAKGFLHDLDQVFAKRINQLSYNMQTLIRTLEMSGSELLDSAGFNVVRTIREGNRVVAVVIGGTVETVIIVGAVIIMLLTLIGGAIFFWRQRRRRGETGAPQTLQLALGSGFFGLITVICALMVFVPSVRASVAAGRVTLSQDDDCAKCVPLAGGFVGEHRAAPPGSLPPDTNEAGTKLLGELYQCLAQGSVGDLRAKAREYAATIERLIGAATRCRRDEECSTSAGEHCQLATGLCTARCDGPQHCAAGQVCHSPDTIGLCAAPCSASSPCTAGLTCSSGGVCEPSSSGTPGGGGHGRGFIPGGVFRDIVIRKALRCPGPDCPIQVCRNCVQPIAPAPSVPSGPPGGPEIRADVLRELRGPAELGNGSVKRMDRFFDPRMRSAATP